MTHEARILVLERAVTKLNRYREDMEKKISRLETFMLNQIDHNTSRRDFEREIANRLAFLKEPEAAPAKRGPGKRKES